MIIAGRPDAVNVATTMFLIKKILTACLVPPFGPLLVIILGLLLQARRPRLGRALAWFGVVSAVLLSLPLTVGWLVAPLENQPPLDLSRVGEAQAIVILGGGRNGYAPEYGGQTVNRLTLERVRYGAVLARQTHLPVLVSGGAPSGGRAEAMLMAQTLSEDFGIQARWLEKASRDTQENAQLSAAILKPLGIQKVILVSHALHLRRAQAEFSAAGLETLAAPTNFAQGTSGDEHIPWLLPNAKAAYTGWMACHEWLGILAQKLRF